MVFILSCLKVKVSLTYFSAFKKEIKYKSYIHSFINKTMINVNQDNLVRKLLYQILLKDNDLVNQSFAILFLILVFVL